MKDHFPKILGAAFLAGAFILLVLAPPNSRFSIANFFAFIACTVTGYLLIAGYIGTHPAASRFRRAAQPAPPSRSGPACPVPEQTHYYSNRSFGAILVASLCAVMGLLLIVLGGFLAWSLPVSGLDRGLVGLPPWIAGALCIWCPLRQLGMYVKVGHQGIRVRSYFRTAEMRWDDVVALVARDHYMLPFGFLGTIYSIYSQRDKLSFTHRLQGTKQLTALIAEATGLQWE